MRFLSPSRHCKLLQNYKNLLKMFDKIGFIVYNNFVVLMQLSRQSTTLVVQRSRVRLSSSAPRRSKLRCNQNDHFLSGHFSYAPLLLLFRKKARSSRLFACKRANYAFVSLPPFCENGDFGTTASILFCFAKTSENIVFSEVLLFLLYIFL